MEDKRLERKDTRFPRRAYKHVNDFIRVQINLRDGTAFGLTLDVNNSFDYVARQIEAEATFRTIDRSAVADQKTPLEDLSKAIDVYQLYDVAGIAIPFSAKVRDALKFDDEIYPVTSLEESELPAKSNSKKPTFLKTGGSVFNLSVSKSLESNSTEATDRLASPLSPTALLFSAIDSELNAKGSVSEDAGVTGYQVKLKDESDESPSRATTVKKSTLSTSGTSIPTSNALMDFASTLDDRLDSVLHNTASLQFFNEFCLQEFSIENVLFWIEAEVFRSITGDLEREFFAREIFNVYVAEGSPLALNLDSEIRQAVALKFERKERGMFSSLQSFIFMLIKNSAYSKFEESNIFQKFLQFKAKDRYAYVQGKTMWSNETLKLKFNDSRLQPDNNKESPLFRHKVLLDTIERYFPKSLSVSTKYFDNEERRERVQRSRRIRKQKRLMKFFGYRPSEEFMKYQNDDENSFEESSENEPLAHNATIRSSSTTPTSIEQKRKKAEKLTGFFGDQLPNREANHQSLVHGVPLSSASKSNGLPYEQQEMEIIGSLNKLSAEERNILQKRSKKLLALLGTDSDGKAISHGQLVNKKHNNAIPSHIIAAQEEEDTSSDPSHSEAQSAISIDPDENTSGYKRKRAEKLQGFFGDLLPNREMKKQSLLASTGDSSISHEESANQSYIDMEKEDDQEFVGGVAALTIEEKVLLQKKAKKLLGVLGDDLDRKTISKKQLVNMDLEGSDEISELDFQSESEDLNIKSYRSKLDKLSKVMGEKIKESQLKDTLTADEQNIARPLSPMEKRAFRKKTDKLERMLGNIVPAEELIHYSNDPEERRYNQDEVSIVSSHDIGRESIDDDEVKQMQLLRLRKLKKVLGITEGMIVTDEALKKINEAINKVVDDEEDKKSIIQELEMYHLTPDEKKVFQRKNLKLENYFGNTPNPNDIIHSITNNVPGARGKEDYSESESERGEVDHTVDHDETETGGRKTLQTSRLRKLKKTLGINDKNGPMSEEAIRAVYDAIVRIDDIEEWELELEKMENVQ